MGITVYWWKSVNVCDFVVFVHDFFAEIRHGLDCSWDTHDVIEIFGQLCIGKLSDDEWNIDIFIIVYFTYLTALVLITWCKGSTIAKIKLTINRVIINVLNLIVSNLIWMDVPIIAGMYHRLYLIFQQLCQVGKCIHQIFVFFRLESQSVQFFISVVLPNELYQSLHFRPLDCHTWRVNLTEIVFIKKDINFVDHQHSVYSALPLQ